MVRRTITHAEWLVEAEQLFGPDSSQWRFVCPVCSHVATVADWQAAGAPEGGVEFSCVGRWAGCKRDAFGLNPDKHKRGELLPAEGDGPCNYAGAGLFCINPVLVKMPDGKEHQVFEFAPAIVEAEGTVQP